ncbi:hypothetical protein HPP92_025823 [Vanilla planifolia]|uniref:Large ribosomal subunit protein eL20 domain-containing protein n=1 Tax=Vanilla planifolia TaxID=51239 RepID=A0A835U843_VANPL|nr:hypothetical protein HPP92_025823 [Vanilla planifolia]
MHIFEKYPTKIKNYGIWVRYQSRTGYHNMYKEHRDTTLNVAVEKMYDEMASQIIKTAIVPSKLCKRESTKQFHDSKFKFHPEAEDYLQGILTQSLHVGIDKLLLLFSL